MARWSVRLACIGVALQALACEPAAAQSKDSEVPAATSPPSDSPDPVEEEVTRSAGDGAFPVALESQCRHTWKGKLIRGQGDGDGSGDPGPFEIRTAKTYELQMRPGDALLLTSPSGGIMDVRFDAMTEGYGAQVEVNSECNGVKRTLVPRPTR